MKEELEHKLYNDFPELFTEEILHYGIAIGDGWYNIIYALCHQLVARKRSLEMIANMTSRSQSASPSLIAHDQERHQHECNQLPKIVQVKEKFGGLRFYADGCTEAQDQLISFAETLSAMTCEVCGAPGTLRTDGWIKCLCDTHHKERKKRYEK